MVNDTNEVQVPLCGVSADINEEWNTGAEELRQRGLKPLLTPYQELSVSNKQTTIDEIQDCLKRLSVLISTL